MNEKSNKSGSYSKKPENRENSAGLHGNFTLLFIYQSQRVQRNTRLQITTTKYL